MIGGTTVLLSGHSPFSLSDKTMYSLPMQVIKSYKETLSKEDREECNYDNGELALFESKVIESTWR